MKLGLKKWMWTGMAGGVFSLTMGIAPLRAEEPVTPPAPPPQPTTPTPAAPSEADKRLKESGDEVLANDEKVRQEIAAQAAAHLEAGRRLFAAFEYERAREELQLAVNLDRTNAEARKLLMRVNDILGVREDRVRSATAQLYGEEKVAVQEKLIELDNRIDWAKRAINQANTDPELSLVERIRKYEQGLTALERARELVKWMPVEVNVQEQYNETNRLISETRKAIKAAQVRLEQVNRDEAVQLANERKENLRKFEDKKVNMMVDRAKALYETGKYESAVDLAEKILDLDPTNAEAHTIIVSSREKFLDKRDKWIAEEYKEQFALAREQADRFVIPHKDYLIYPENWAEIQQRTADTVARKTEEPWKQEIRRKLQRRVSFDFVETPLSEAISFLNSLTKVNIILDPKVAAAGTDKTPINLRVTDMAMDQALGWVLRLAELEFDLRSNAVFVTQKADLSSNVELQIYDIRDLTTSVADFPGPRIDVGTAQGGQVANPFAAPPANTGLQSTDLQQLIKDRLLPAEFADPATAIDESGGKLIVMQRPEIHDRIQQLLRSFRETQTIQVLTQVRFIDVSDNFLEHIGVHFTGLDAAPGEPGVPNAAVDPLRQPSRYGLFPTGGGPGLPSGVFSDIQPSPAFQFQDFVGRPPFIQRYGPNDSQPDPRPITLLRPRLDPNFPVRGNSNVGPALAPAGFRRQWYSKAFGSPVLVQGLTQNLLRPNPLTSALGLSFQNAPQQGALFQFRFLQSIQASAVVQALRKDQTADQLLAPKLMQYNNQRSHILVAQQRSYIRDYDVSGAVFDPVISSFLVGVVLEVKPTVSNDKRYITLDVRPGTALELTPPQIIFITNGGDINNPLGNINLPVELPNLELRSISTTVTVPDNGTMLFSGLISDRKIDAKSGIPFFSDLPIIGRFFSTNNKERLRRNLLVLINSKIVLFDEAEAAL